MLRVLSIDFDYFVDVTSKERDMMFPQAIGEDNVEAIREEWDKQIEKFPEIEDIGVIEDLVKVKNYLAKNSKQSIVRVADNHKDISKITEILPPLEPVEIINVDYHHDYYYLEKERNSGNWLRLLKESRPHTKIEWIRREDSQIESLAGVFPHTNGTLIDNALKGDYDCIFICFSPEWTPPHLEVEFNKLRESLRGSIINDR